VFNFGIPAGQTGATGPGVPIGGTDGQVLAKIDTTDYNTQWVTPFALQVRNQVRNETGAQLDKGTVVYVNGAAGNKVTVTKALATGDATSAQTFAVLLENIPNNQNGYAVTSGLLENLDTSAYAAGTQLYLSPTVAGTYTSTKPSAPDHLVYIGVIERSHVNQGTMLVRIQNGYELDELHDVAIASKTNNDLLAYESANEPLEEQVLLDPRAADLGHGGEHLLPPDEPGGLHRRDGAGPLSHDRLGGGHLPDDRRDVGLPDHGHGGLDLPCHGE